MFNFQEVRDVVRGMEWPVLSLYLQVGNEVRENQADQPAWMIFVKNTLRTQGQNIADDQKDAWKSIHERAEAYFEAYRSNSKGLVAFFSADGEQIYELPVPPQENTASLGEPLIVPMLWLMDEYEPYLVVLIDQDQAQFFKTYLGQIDLEQKVTSDRFSYDFREHSLMPRPTAPQGAGSQVTAGSNRDVFDDMIQEWINRLYRDVAQKIRDTVQKEGQHRIILGGAEKSAAALKDLLHEDVAKDVVAVLPITMHDTQQQIIDRMLPAAIEYERKSEMELVSQIIDFAKAGGRGALGEKDVQEALEQQRVELLVMPWPGGGLDDEIMQEYTLRAMESGSQFEMVHGEAADRLMQEGKVAARLYYAIQPA